ncbi:Crp/Fnr family transcriptional regulator [Carnobacterium maltaromaticum]|uniref:Crp/Fnr family transcriptional regulator n=1 Tax=Carnobacterium maltaromaticum TaxID=2751 RepID=UPI00191B98CE|nr:Crp/Fnr family transcriptional regulator [Carnobacterium maltaromaticum]CAD5900045.1 Cyclic nucleotide-binding domain protein [Carnobacterium maltaromaticum]
MKDFIQYSSYLTSKFKDMVKMRKVSENEMIIDSTGYLKREEKIYIITSGQAVLQLKNNIGKNDFYSIVTENQLFGIEYFLNKEDKLRNIDYSVKSKTKVTYLVVESQFFIDHMYNNPQLYHSVLNNIIKQNMLLVQSYALMNEPTIVRIANALIELALILKLESNKKEKVVFPNYMTQKFIANYSNASVGRTSIAFNQLESLGIIKRNPIRIMNFEKIKQIRLSSTRKSLYKEKTCEIED